MKKKKEYMDIRLLRKIETALSETCYERSRSIYGEDLPPIVGDRLERELNFIIPNASAPLFINDPQLAPQYRDVEYPVDFRGAAAASLVAFLTGITGIDPLPPHYTCPKCHYSDFATGSEEPFSRKTWVDLPDKTCPVCGSRLRKSGFDIPIETLFGMNGKRIPYIDTSVPDDDYLALIKAIEDHVNSPETDNEFDEEHPFSADDIPLDDEKVISLFRDAATLGIPDFESDTAMDVLRQTTPKKLSDLIQVFGLSNGAGTWHDNAGRLIRDGKATLSEVICTRDDILHDLNRAGMDKSDAYDVMNIVRKGFAARGLWPRSQQKTVREAGMPDWYVPSCKKIKYLVPRAYAAFYTVMDYRIAYCKIYYPSAFYKAYCELHSNALPDQNMNVLLEMKARGLG